MMTHGSHAWYSHSIQLRFAIGFGQVGDMKHILSSSGHPVPRSDQRLLPIRDTQLCVQTFGQSTDPVLLVISGAATSMDCWDDEFCAAIAAGGHLVIRYDHRDTGGSAVDPTGEPCYSSRDLAEDAIGVLDALHIHRAHLAGVSMGGGLAQTLAVTHPHRTASLVLIATSPALGRKPGAPQLPPVEERIRHAFQDPAPEPDWDDQEAAIQYLTEDLLAFRGSRGIGEKEAHSMAVQVVRRSPRIASRGNHWIVIAGDHGEEEPRHLTDIIAPTLVIHGGEDPVFPLAHGKALASEIPGARLLVVPGMGHEVPPRTSWDTVVEEILRHTSGVNV